MPTKTPNPEFDLNLFGIDRKALKMTQIIQLTSPRTTYLLTEPGTTDYAAGGCLL
jgi:hypothetical protein